jgi:heme-degrading monooxygenase HmoA
VILRVWRAEIAPERVGEYRRFERERCLPMLRRQPGFLGVLFLRAAEGRVASVTIWEDRGAEEALESSPSYRETIRDLTRSGLLAGEQSVETLDVAGGDLRPESLGMALGLAKRRSSSGEAAT